MGVSSSIKTAVKVVVITERRGDSAEQELLVSSTVLSTKDSTRAPFHFASRHVMTSSASACADGVFPSAMAMTRDEECACDDDIAAKDGRKHTEKSVRWNCIST